MYYEFIPNPESPQTLVFVHGWAETHKIWREQIEYFKNEFQILSYDLRGFGLSSKPVYGYSLNTQANHLHNLIQSLELQNYWLIGHSLGGMLTLQYCEKFIGEVRGGVLIDTTSRIPVKVSTWRNLGTFFVSKTLRKIWQKSLETVRADNRKTLMEGLLHDVDSVPLYVSAASGIAVLNSKVHLSGILCPILIIVGAEDSLTPVDLSEQMHQRLPNSQLVIIPDTGHMSFIEKPDEINSSITTFLRG